MANDQDKAGQQGGAAQTNPGSLQTTVRRLRKPARKAVKCPEGNLRINKQGKAAAVTLRKIILSVPVVEPNTVVKEGIPLAANLTGSKVWTKGRKLFRTKTAG